MGDDAREALARLAEAGQRVARLAGPQDVRRRARRRRRRRQGLQAVLAATVLFSGAAVAVPLLQRDVEEAQGVSLTSTPTGTASATPTPTPATPTPTTSPTTAEPAPEPLAPPLAAPGPTPGSTAGEPASPPPPTPAPALELVLTSMCSSDPQASRVWRVRNGNPESLDYRWDLVGSAQGQAGGGSASPGDSFFSTATEDGPNTLRLFVDGILHDTKAGNPEACG